MTAVAFLFSGATVGFGLWLLGQWARPSTGAVGMAPGWRRSEPVVSVAELRLRRLSGEGKTNARPGRTFLPTRRASETLIDQDLARDLRLVEVSEETLLTRLAVGGLITLVSMSIIGRLGLPAIGLSLSWPVAMAMTLGSTAAVCWMLLGQIRDQAEQRRQEFAAVVGQFVMFTDVMVSGGRSIDGSLTQSAELGEGWAWDELRYSLARAAHASRPPHEGLAELGAKLGVAELTNLARRLAHTQSTGAAIGPALRSLAELSAADHARRIKTADDKVTETMTFPQMVVLISLLIFFAIAAVHAILQVSQTF